MPLILGLDPAWTSKEPSGVVLVHSQSKSWKALAIAPSYDSFVALAEGRSVDWSARPNGGEPDAKAVIDAAARLSGGCKPDLVVGDIPLSKSPIVKRRPADDEISKAFGARWCSTHSPTLKRPGSLGQRFQSGLSEVGYPLTTSWPFPDKALIEAYPHPALLALIDSEKRVPYKVSKSKKYWPRSGIEERKQNLLKSFEGILDRLSSRISDIQLELPSAGNVPTLSFLKRYEDVLDALVCCWVGIETLAGHAVSYGDDEAVIWVPRESR